MSLEVGQLVDNKYRIVRLIGEGGMGAVFEGENVRINRRVAIKILHAAFTGNAEVMQRFEREAQAAGRIGNDHILEVLDLGILPDGDRYIIMEFLEGEPLSNRIQGRGRLLPHELAPLMRQTLVGLGAAHAVGIVHRDLKPDNIFIQREKAGQKDYVKIIDFGISKFQPLSGDGMKMTRTGAVMGTPYYMSPEQASGSGEADARSDVYSLGVIMYEAVTGRVPFDAGTFNQLMFKIVLADVPPPQSVVPDLDPAFASIISQTMARDLSHRFQSTAEVIRALDEWLQSGRSVTVPPAGEATGARHLPAGARGSLATMSDAEDPGQKTAGSWETSQAAAAPLVIPTKSAAPVIAALLGLGLLVLGGGAFAGLFVAREVTRGGELGSARYGERCRAERAADRCSGAERCRRSSSAQRADSCIVCRAARPHRGAFRHSRRSSSCGRARACGSRCRAERVAAKACRAARSGPAPRKRKARSSASTGKARGARFRLLSRARNYFAALRVGRPALLALARCGT